MSHEIFAKRDLFFKNPVSVTRYYHLVSDGCINVHQNLASSTKQHIANIKRRKIQGGK